MLQNCCELGKDVFLFRFLFPCALICFRAICFFAGSTDGLVKPVFISWCISVLFKQGYQNLAVEKKAKCFKLTVLYVRVVMSSK